MVGTGIGVGQLKVGGMLAAMMDNIEHIDLTSEQYHSDTWQWLLGKEGVFTVGETRKHIDKFMLDLNFIEEKNRVV